MSASLLHQTPQIANGNIRPARVLTGVSGTPFAVVEAADGTLPPVGVSKYGQRFPVGSPANDGFIAVAGESVPNFGYGQKGVVMVGTAITAVTVPVVAYTDGTVGAGAVKPVNFASGQTTGLYFAGLALDTASAGDLVALHFLSVAFSHPALS